MKEVTYPDGTTIDTNVGSVNVQYTGTRAQPMSLVSASASAYIGASTYSFFNATGNTRCTVACSDRTITYNQNGTIYN